MLREMHIAFAGCRSLAAIGQHALNFLEKQAQAGKMVHTVSFFLMDGLYCNGLEKSLGFL